MAAGDVTRTIDTARRALNDLGPVYKWRDVELCAYLTQGQVELIKLRPDAVVTTPDVIPITAPTVISSKTGSLSVDAMFEPVLSDYVCYQALMKHTQYADPSKGAGYYKMFQESALR
jgi:hypothetical protein